MSVTIPVDGAISRVRRDLTIAALLRGAMTLAIVFCVCVGPWVGLKSNGLIFVVGLSALWAVLSYRSVQGSRMAADSPMLIAAGQYDLAEEKIDSSLRRFSLFRTVKLLSLHHLALLRHAQRRWRESALLCQALLSQKLGSLQVLSRSTRLLMADAMLQLNDLPGALAAMAGLYQQQLSLSEALTLQLLQLDYSARTGAWRQMLAGVGAKVQLSELMPAANAARSQALLSLAAAKMGKAELSRWLRRRAELLAGREEMIAERPVLKELFGDAAKDAA